MSVETFVSFGLSVILFAVRWFFFSFLCVFFAFWPYFWNFFGRSISIYCGFSNQIFQDRPLSFFSTVVKIYVFQILTIWNINIMKNISERKNSIRFKIKIGCFVVLHQISHCNMCLILSFQRKLLYIRLCFGSFLTCFICSICSIQNHIPFQRPFGHTLNFFSLTIYWRGLSVVLLGVHNKDEHQYKRYNKNNRKYSEE